jgi:hypothetical protein
MVLAFGLLIIGALLAWQVAAVLPATTDNWRGDYR